MMVGLFWVMVGSSRFILGDGGWRWIILGCGEWWWVYFGCWWMVVVGGGFIFGSGEWWWMMVRLFWLELSLFWVVGGGGWWTVLFGWRWVMVCIFWVVVGGGGYFLGGGRCWWVVARYIIALFSCRKTAQLGRHDNMRKICYEKSYTKYSGKAFSRTFSKKSKLSMSLDQWSKT